MRHPPDHESPTGSSGGTLLGSDFPLPLTKPFTPDQARAAGISQHTFAKLLRSGHLRRVIRGVYAVAQAPDDVLMRASALALVIPPTAVVTDRTAAWLHGVEILPRTALTTAPPIDVAHVDDTRVRRPEVDGRRRGLLRTDITEVHGVRVTTALRTALDLGRLLWRFDALAAIDGFLRIGVPHELLILEIGRFKGYRGVRQLRALAPLGDGRAESPGESALRLALVRRGLCRSPSCRSGSTPTRAHPSFGWTSPTRRSATQRSTTVKRCTPRSTTGSTTSPAASGSRINGHGRSTRSGRNDVYARDAYPVAQLQAGHVQARRSVSAVDATSSYGLSNCPLGVLRPHEMPAQRSTSRRSNCPLGVLQPRETARSAGLEGGGGGLVEPPGAVLAGDASGGGLVDRAVVGEGSGDCFGLVLAGDARTRPRGCG